MLCYGTKITYSEALDAALLLVSLLSTTVSITILIFVNGFQDGGVSSSDFSDWMNVNRNCIVTTLV
jgi:hypothetical protein